MNYKLLNGKTILVERDFKILSSDSSDELFFNVLSLVGKSTSYFENRKISYYLFYNRVSNYINSLITNNKINQLLNCKPKSSSNARNKEAVH